MLRSLIMIQSMFVYALLGVVLQPMAQANTKTEWQKNIFREFDKLYRPVARSNGKSFEIRIEKNDSSSAAAETDTKRVAVIANTGLLKNSTLSPDGLRMIICHELGHIFGGAPRKNVPPEWDGPSAQDGRSFTSSEGQADYYASASCFHRIIRGSNHQEALVNVSAASRAQRQCDSRLGANSEESLICQRAAAGAENMLQLNRVSPISYSTPNQSVSDKIITDSYPDRQCRLDTFLMGAVCRSDIPIVMDFNDASANDCKDAYRPLCWYPVPITAREKIGESSTTALANTNGSATQH